MVKLFYTTYISVDLAHHDIFRTKVGKGGIMADMRPGLAPWNTHTFIVYGQKHIECMYSFS